MRELSLTSLHQSQPPRSDRRVLQVEYNELSPHLLSDLMAAGHLPNFRRIHDTSHVFTTDARAEPPVLEP